MRKHHLGGWSDWMIIALSIALFLTALFLPFGWAIAKESSQEEMMLMDALESGQIIRLHIMANSDSREDQTLKLKVRDAVIREFGEVIAEKNLQDSEQAYRTLEESTALILNTAQDCARSLGYAGDIHAETGVFLLPAKRYGAVLLPEGYYRAMRITLGKGEGQNWWCILFPQLCLALTQDETQTNGLFWTSQRIWQNWLAAEV